MTLRLPLSRPLSLLALGCVFVGTPVNADPPLYQIVEFEPVDGLKFNGHRLNEGGAVLGYVLRTVNNRNYFAPAVCRDGVCFTPPSRFDAFEGFITDINDQNILVGYEEYSLPAGQALVTNGTALRNLGTLGGGYSYALAVNNTGTIVGYSTYGDLGSVSTAFTWKNGVMNELTPLADGYSYALEVNDRGDIAGWSWDEGWNQRAVMWPANGGGPIRLTDNTGPTFPEQASDINESGQIVGQMGVNEKLSFFHAFMWENGTLRDLGVLDEAGREGPYGPELINTRATGINDVGQIVGNSEPHFPDKEFDTRPGPFIYQDGEMHNLNDRLDPAFPTDLIISSTIDINNAGTILATVFEGPNVFDSRTVLLVPTTK